MESFENRQNQLRSCLDKLVLAGLAVFALLFVLILATPNHVNRRVDRRASARLGCIHNLRQIDGAKQQWALENKAPSNAVPIWDNIQPYLGRGTGGTIPKCPEGGIYTIGSLTDNPTCSIQGHALD